MFQSQHEIEMNNFAERMITIITGCSISIYLVMFSKETLILLFSIFGIGAYVEYQTLMSPKMNNLTKIYLAVFPYFCYSLFKVYILQKLDTWWFWLFLGVFDFFYVLAMYGGVKNSIIGLIWIMPSMLICIEYGIEDPIKVIVLMTITWQTDGFAYLTGKLLGRTKLAHAISPNKTIEGTLGGLLASVITAYFISNYYFGISKFDLCVLAVICGITGQIGDLVESKFKRQLKIKDSGKLMFGHGGVLDRFDSVFFAIPASWIYLNLIY
ncbi:MAG: phosphatidate cytidylyltransferase [Candidatus Roizmanbacteria bacterium]